MKMQELNGNDIKEPMKKPCLVKYVRLCGQRHYTAIDPPFFLNRGDRIEAVTAQLKGGEKVFLIEQFESVLVEVI